MKLIDAIKQVKRPAPGEKTYHYWPYDAVIAELGISDPYYPPEALEERLGCYPIFNWLCTDEHVGLDALYLDDEPVGCAYRSARKNGYEIKWLPGCPEKVREVILSYAEGPDTFDFIDPEEEVGEFQTMAYTGQALTEHGFYEGRPVKALVWYDDIYRRSTPVEYRREGRAYTEGVPHEDPKANCVLVQDGDEQRVISIDDFMIPINVEKVDA